MQTLRAILVVGLLFWSPSVFAQAPVPAREWTDSTRLALAQCLVGERNWDARTEWAAIAHVLAKRARRSGQHFERMVRRYCAAHGNPRPTARQLWVRALPWGELTDDPGFPPTVDFRNYVDDWRRVRAFVFEFEMGLIRDPLPAATFFGSRHDLRALPFETQSRIRVLSSVVIDPETGERVLLRNVFYTLRRRGPEDGSSTAPSGAILAARDAV